MDVANPLDAIPWRPLEVRMIERDNILIDGNHLNWIEE